MSSFALRALTPFSSANQNFPRVADAARQQISTPQLDDATTTEIARQLATPSTPTEHEGTAAAHPDVMAALSEILSAAQTLAEHIGEVMMKAVATQQIPDEKPESVSTTSTLLFATPPPKHFKALQTYEFTALMAAFKIESPALNVSPERLVKPAPALFSQGVTMAPVDGTFTPKSLAPSAFEFAPTSTASAATKFLADLIEQISSQEEALTPNALDFRVSA